MTLEQLALRYVWWQSAAETLAAPEKLITQVLSLGRPEDYAQLRDAYGEPAIVAALENAAPGAIDPRSWQYWRLRFGLPERDPPARSFS